MNSLKISQRSSRATTGVRLTRRELRVAESQFRVTSPRAPAAVRTPASSTPTLQHWFENRFGWVVMLFVAALVFAITGCGNVRPGGHPASTMTLPDRQPNCAHGMKTRQTGAIGTYGTPVVEVTSKPCGGAR